MTQKCILVSFFIFALAACGTHDPDTSLTNTPSSSSLSPAETATITFDNYSSYDVDIYRNGMTPEKFVCSVEFGKKTTVTIRKSEDDLVGDNFFYRYKIRLEENIYINADGTGENGTFVVKAGKTHTEDIHDPDKSKLKFVNGYVRIRNIGASAIGFLQGNSPLKRLGQTEESKQLHIQSGEYGYFEFGIPIYDDNETTIYQLRIDDYTNESAFPLGETGTLKIERGKLYSFEVDNRDVVGPITSSIDP